MSKRNSSLIAVLLLACTLAAQDRTSMLPKSRPQANRNVNAAANDISGMYSFLREGEFVQITLEPDGVSGYISRRGDLPSDDGAFLDHFFEKASVKDHDVSFTTRAVHGVWFEFTGRYQRGPAKSKDQDGYFIMRGTLKKFTEGPKSTTSRSRDVEFKLLAQPPEEDSSARKKKD